MPAVLDQHEIDKNAVRAAIARMVWPLPPDVEERALALFDAVAGADTDAARFVWNKYAPAGYQR